MMTVVLGTVLGHLRRLQPRVLRVQLSSCWPRLDDDDDVPCLNILVDVSQICRCLARGISLQAATMRRH